MCYILQYKASETFSFSLGNQPEFWDDILRMWICHFLLKIIWFIRVIIYFLCSISAAEIPYFNKYKYFSKTKHADCIYLNSHLLSISKFISHCNYFLDSHPWLKNPMFETKFGQYVQDSTLTTVRPIDPRYPFSSLPYGPYEILV